MSRNTLKTLLTKLRKVPYPSQGSKALPETSQDFLSNFPRLPEQFPKASLQFLRPSLTSLQLPKKTQKPEKTQPEACTGMTRPNPVSQCGQVPLQIFPDSYCSCCSVPCTSSCCVP